MPNDDAEDMTDIRVPIDIEDPPEEPATMKPGGPRSRGTGVTAAPWTSDPPRKNEIDEDPSISIEPRTIKKASKPPPHNASPAADEPQSITLEPQMSVRGIDPAVLARMKNALADSGEGAPVASEVVSTDPAPAPTPPKTFPKRKMTLIGVGERPPALPGDDDPSTITMTPEQARLLDNTDIEETEKRPAALLETPITLTEPIPIASRMPLDTEAEAKEDLTTRDVIEPAPKTAKLTPATMQSPKLGPIAFATTEKADGPSRPRPVPSKPPPPVPSKSPPPVPSKPPPTAPLPPRPTAQKPAPPVLVAKVEPPPADTPSVRTRKETIPMLDRPMPDAPRVPLESEDSSPRSLGGAVAPQPDDKHEVSPHVRRTAYGLAASFVLAGALASAFVVWQAGSAKRTTNVAVHSASTAAPDEAPPATASAPRAPEPEPPPASATVVKAPPAPTPPPPASTAALPPPPPAPTAAKPPPTPTPREQPPPAPKPPPKPHVTARPPPPSPPPAPKPKPASTVFDPGAI